MDVSSFILISYVILFGGAFILFVLSVQYDISREDVVQSFTKTLYGGLYHFQCPYCHGFFAVKESMYHAQGKTVMTCPDCGKIGRIHSSPPRTIRLIPEKKSENVLFKCVYCGESLNVWAEGADLYPKLNVFSCPYCGRKKPMKEC